jgi:hypothetical protein
MAMIGKVKRMFFREKKSVREIVRLTSLSRNTVRKWLKAAALDELRYRRSDAPGKLTPFHESSRQALKVDAHRSRHERRTARALHAQIRIEGYGGGHSRVTDFVRAWRHGEGQSISTTAFVPLAFELGEAFQFDWSEEGLVVGGLCYRMQVSHLKLCASRAFWLVVYPSQGHEMLFDAHTHSFTALGGIARRGIYDLHVDRCRQGEERQGPHGQRALRGDGLRPSRLPPRKQRCNQEVNKPGTDLHLSTVGRHAASVRPRVSIGSAGWVNMGSAPTLPAMTCCSTLRFERQQLNRGVNRNCSDSRRMQWFVSGPSFPADMTRCARVGVSGSDSLGRSVRERTDHPSLGDLRCL